MAKKKKKKFIILKAGVRRSKERKEKKFKDRFGRGMGVKGGGTKRKSSLSLHSLSLCTRPETKNLPKRREEQYKKAQKNYIYIHIS